MQTLTSLVATNANIQSLGGIESLSNLTDLDLASNSISDLTPLEGLTQLTFLRLGHNSISDITPVAGLTQLTKLWLFSNSISDITPLAGLTQLTELWLFSNSISDITPLAALTEVTDFRLEGNPISDITALVSNPGLGAGDSIRLTGTALELDDCPDLEALIGRGVDIDHDVICEPISPVTFDDPTLENEVREALGIGPTDPLTLAAVQTLTSLTASSRVDIQSLGGIEALSNLTVLDLGSNSISDLTPLAGLTQLTVLDLRTNSISDITPLAGLTQLTFLGLGSNSISDITALVANPGLGGGDLIELTGTAIELDDCPDLENLIGRGVDVDHDLICESPLPSVTFGGDGDNSFNNPDNWDSGGVPGSGENAVIPEGSGEVTLDNSVNVGGIVVSSGSTLKVTPSATLTLDESLSNVVSGGTLQIDGSLEILAGSTLNVDGALDNAGELTISGDVTGSGTIDNTSAMTVSSATLDVDLNNEGSVEINGTLMLTKASQGSGSYSLDNGDSLDFEDGLHQFEMTVIGPSSGSATVEIGSSASVLLVGGPEELAVATSSPPLRSEHLESQGQVDIQGNTDVTNSGTVTWDGGSINLGGSASLVNENTGTLNLAATTDGSPALLVEDGGTFTNGGTVTWSGGTIEMQGSARLENQEGAVFAGSGTIIGDVQNAGAFTVGGSIGDITVTGDYEQTPSGSLNVELEGASNFDVLTVGSSTLDGTLNVSLLNDFSPNIWESFPIVLGPTTGCMHKTNLPELRRD